jgi:hypothetical protein
MSVKTFPDIEGAMRTWLQAQTEMTVLIADRDFFGYPESSKTQTPLIVMQRIGGGPLPGEAPIDLALLQFDCWGGVRNKAQANQVALALIGVLASMTAQQLSGAFVYGCSVGSSIWSPDPESDQARYVVTASVTSRT